MLKTSLREEVWLVHQPDHARVAGYLAAHWGNANGFARPGYYAASANPELIRQEVVLAIAEHDNGWWEWEASPPIDPADGLPLGLAQVGSYSPAEGLNRWRLGVPRLAEQHPYVALLISLHAYHLYCIALEDDEQPDPALLHPLFGSVDQARGLVSDAEQTRLFLRGQHEVQETLLERLATDRVWREAAEPSHRYPHLRLLQLMDALSLLLAFGGQQERSLADIPRSGWEDRTTIAWRPAAEHRIVCDPYPFDTDPLDVYLPVRILPRQTDARSLEVEYPLTRLHALPLQTVRFQLSSPLRL